MTHVNMLMSLVHFLTSHVLAGHCVISEVSRKTVKFNTGTKITTVSVLVF